MNTKFDISTQTYFWWISVVHRSVWHLFHVFDICFGEASSLRHISINMIVLSAVMLVMEITSKSCISISHNMSFAHMWENGKWQLVTWCNVRHQIGVGLKSSFIVVLWLVLRSRTDYNSFHWCEPTTQMYLILVCQTYVAGERFLALQKDIFYTMTIFIPSTNLQTPVMGMLIP